MEFNWQEQYSAPLPQRPRSVRKNQRTFHPPNCPIRPRPLTKQDIDSLQLSKRRLIVLF